MAEKVSWKKLLRLDMDTWSLLVIREKLVFTLSNDRRAWSIHKFMGREVPAKIKNKKYKVEMMPYEGGEISLREGVAESICRI